MSLKPEKLDVTQRALSRINSELDRRIQYSEEELEAMRQVQNRLQEQDNITNLNPRFLAYLVIICKNRVDEAIDKFRRYLKAIAPFDMVSVESDDDMWADPHVEQFLNDFYVPCGRDFEGRQIMWVRSERAVQLSEEKTFVRAGILYIIAIHADDVSLREGVTFVIDISKRGTFQQSTHEAQLQRINQSIPFRPQALYIAGASTTMRIVVNGLIRVASMFTKQKLLQRIKFVSLEQVKASVPLESAPVYVGGGGGGSGGSSEANNVFEWTKRRYFQLPIPEL